MGKVCGIILEKGKKLKPKQYEELGKGFINLANIIGGLSVINGIFGVNKIEPLIIPLVGYIVIGLYFAGITLIGKGIE